MKNMGLKYLETRVMRYSWLLERGLLSGSGKPQLLKDKKSPPLEATRDMQTITSTQLKSRANLKIDPHALVLTEDL
jgi:hypothetical protein